MTMLIDLDDGMDVEIPDLPEFDSDMLEVVDGPHDESSKVLEEWRKPASPLDDVVDEIMQIDVQLGEDLLDDKFFFNEDPCLSPTSALDDLVFSSNSLDEKELKLFAYPEEVEEKALEPHVPSNIPTPPPSMFTLNQSKPNPPAPAPASSSTTITHPPSYPVARPPVSTPHFPVPIPGAATRGPLLVPVHGQVPGPGRFAQGPYSFAISGAPLIPAKPRSRPKPKKIPPKLNYIPAPPHMQPQAIAVAAAAVGAQRASAARLATYSARKPLHIAPRKPAVSRPAARRNAPGPVPSNTASPKIPDAPTLDTGSTPPSSPRSPPAFMTDEKYQTTLQKLTESMIRSQESRKSLQMKSPKMEKYARSKSVSKVLSSIEHSTRQIQTYLQGPSYHHPPIHPPAEARKK